MRRILELCTVFSRDFLHGLETKSENFQNNFYGIIDKICSYLDSDEEKQEFQKYIEQHHSYDKPDNMLYSFGTIFGGEQSDCEEFKKEIHSLCFWGFLMITSQRMQLPLFLTL